MSIKQKLMLILLILNFNSIARDADPKWSYNIFELHDLLGLNDEQIETNYLKSSLQSCINNILDDNKCGFAYIWIKLLAKIDKNTSNNIAQYVLNNLPINSENYNLINIREDAIRALAYHGNISQLMEEVGNKTPSLDDAYVLANGGNYSWYNTVLKPLEHGKSAWKFCNSLNYIYPFLNINHQHRGRFINEVIVNLVNSNYIISRCSTNFIINNFEKNNIQFNTEESVSTLFASKDFRVQKNSLLLIEWKGSLFKSDMILISKIINETVLATNTNKRYYFSNLLLDLGLISQRFQVDSSIGDYATDEVIVTGASFDDDLTEYLMEHPYTNIWKNYINTALFSEMKKILNEASEYSNDLIDFSEKINYLNHISLIQNNLFLKYQLTEVAFKANSPLAPQLLDELYASADALQKTALIGRYLDHFATKPVVRVKTTDPWIKLAEVTNLLTICKIEVPAIGSELSDPKILTKYLEKAETLLKDCNRINK